MKQHFEHVPLPLSIAVNCIVGILLLPVTGLAELCLRGFSGDIVSGLAMLAAAAAFTLGANRLVYSFMKKRTEADITVSDRSAEASTLASVLTAVLPSAAELKFGAVSEEMIGAVCINVAVFVFALTIYYSRRHEPAQRNR